MALTQTQYLTDKGNLQEQANQASINSIKAASAATASPAQYGDLSVYDTGTQNSLKAQMNAISNANNALQKLTLAKTISVSQANNNANRDLAQTYDAQRSALKQQSQNNALAQGLTGQLPTAQKLNNALATNLADQKVAALKQAVSDQSSDRAQKKSAFDTEMSGAQTALTAQENAMNGMVSAAQTKRTETQNINDWNQQKQDLVNGYKVEIANTQADMATPGLTAGQKSAMQNLINVYQNAINNVNARTYI
jgi:hypothetical protein